MIRNVVYVLAVLTMCISAQAEIPEVATHISKPSHRRTPDPAEFSPPRVMPHPRPASPYPLAPRDIDQALREMAAPPFGTVRVVECSGRRDHQTIQEAIDAAVDGDVIVVLPNTCNNSGHYLENINYTGKAITVRSLAPHNPSVVAATVISGSGADVSTVRFLSGEGPRSVLAGLTITGGSGTEGDYSNTGWPEVSHWGGGIICAAAAPIITRCHVLSNTAGLGGGIAVLSDAGPRIEYSTIADNLASFEVLDIGDNLGVVLPQGGGIVIWDSHAVIHRCTVSGNTLDTFDNTGQWTGATFGWGGGIAIGQPNAGDTDVLISNCHIERNRMIRFTADSQGGGVSAIRFSGGGNKSVRIENSILTDNTVEPMELYCGGGTGTAFAASTPAFPSEMVGCTVVHNDSDCAEHAVIAAAIHNSIIRDNHTMIGQLVSSEVSYSNSTDDISPLGPGNVDAEPQFVSRLAGDFRLLPGSPCIDAGNPDFMPGRYARDIGDLRRVLGGRVDIGAHEFTTDCNGNAIPDAVEIERGSSRDCNKNHMPDECEPDCNRNGIPDECDPVILIAEEACRPNSESTCRVEFIDCNDNLVTDYCDVVLEVSADCNENLVPDECEPDCNNNDMADACDIASGTSTDGLPSAGDGIPDDCQSDCNGNGVPDAADLDANTSQDCNSNDLPDECDIAAADSPDCNTNDIPDECEVGFDLDCNQNGVPDFCDLDDGTSVDVLPPDGDGIPDECQSDCNQNNVPDDVDLADSTSSDCDSSGVPDECEMDVNCFVTWYVDDDCLAPGSGTEQDPFCTIQQAVDIAMDDHTILVGPGTYTGSGNRDLSLFGKTITLKSTGGPEVTTIDAQGTPDAIHRGFFLSDGETAATVIEGFTITGGYLTGQFGETGGGGGAGIYISNSSPTLRRCIVRNNFSGGRGGGIFVDGNSSAVFDRCSIIDNISESRGGGIYSGYFDSAVTLRQCLIARNVAGAGGGLSNFGGPLRLLNSIVAYNSSGGGGGIISENSPMSITNSIVWGNFLFPDQEVNSGTEQMQVSCNQNPVIAHSVFPRYPGSVGGSCTAGIIWGPGLVESDPLLVAPNDQVYRLSAGSPAIDAGDNLAVADAQLDFDGKPRFVDDPATPDTGVPDGINPPVDIGPYEFDPDDCNNNSLPDADDIASGRSPDCNGNGIPDDCEPDCNGNGVADPCDITAGTSLDCTQNGLPDECEFDCNGNDIADSCDVASGDSLDCNENLIPDECEADCNENNLPDECDIVSGSSSDCDDSGVPDECELIGPVFLQLPESQTVEPGTAVLFSVVTQGGTIHQWFKDDEELEDSERVIGSTLPSLLILDVIPADSGEYTIMVTDGSGCFETTPPATLTVVTTPGR